MNFFLSVILCIAMAVGGTAQLPAQPETMARWTLYNLTIGNGEESASLHEKAVLRSAVSQDAAQLQFHINNGGSQVLPVALNLDAENILFSFGTGARAYSLNYDALLEASEVEKEEIEFMDHVSTFMLDLGRLLALMQDPEQAKKVDSAIDSLDEGLLTETKGAEAVIDGVLYPAQYRRGSYNDLSFLEALQEAQQTGVDELDALLRSIADIICLTEGVDTEKGYAGLLERFSVDADEMLETTVETITMEQDGLKYEWSETSASDEEIEYSMQNTTEHIERPDGADFKSQLRNINGKNRMALDARIHTDGPSEAPHAMELTANFRMEDDYSAPVEWSEEELIYICIETTAMDVRLQIENADGQPKTVLDVQGYAAIDKGYEGDMIHEEEPFELHFECIESEAANDEHVYSCSMDLPVGKDTLSLSFDLLRSSEAYADAFGEMPVYELDLADENSAAQTMLMSDVMAFSGNLMLLNAQDDVMAASKVLQNLQRYGEFVEMDGIDAAREAFAAPIPDFVPPAGYELDIVEMAADGSCVDCYYWSAAKSEYLLVSFYDFRGKARYEGMDEAALEKGTIVHSEVVDGVIHYMDVYTTDVHVCFSTGGISATEADQLLKGLDIVSLYLDEAEIQARRDASKSKL